jgi:drug/metabolite transporter (DMT)-like permease
MDWRILSVLVVLGWGFGSFLAKLANRYGSPYQVYIFEFLGTSITASLFVIYYRRALKKAFLYPDWRLIVSGVLMGVSWTLATVMFILALGRERASIITSLTSLYPAVTLFLAVILLKESVRPHEVLGIVLVLAGGFLLSL